jgi:Putative beta-barrel porin 2
MGALSLLSLLILLVVLPSPASGQTAPTFGLPSPIQAPPPEFEPPSRIPPPSTIPSAPTVPVPTVVPAERSVKMFDVKPSVTASEEFSDNFNRTAVNPRSNFRSTVTPAVSVATDRPPVFGQIAYLLSANYDTSSARESLFNAAAAHLTWSATRRLRLLLDGDFTQSDVGAQADRLGLQQQRQKFTRTGLSLAGDYSITQWTAHPYYRLSEFSLSGGAGADTMTHILGATASRGLNGSNTITLGYEYITSDTALGPNAGRSDVSGHEFTGSVYRALTSLTTVGLAGSYAFRTQETTRPVSTMDFTRWSVSLFNTYSLANHLAMRGSLGLSAVNGGGFTGQPQITSQTSLTYWFAHAIATVSVERGFAETFAQGQNFGVVETTGFAGSLSYSFTPSLSAFATVSDRQNKFTGVGASGGRRTEDVLATSLTFTLRVTQRIISSLDYTHTEFSSSLKGNDFTENRVRATIQASY